jgi:hypothetical protein
MSLIQEFSKGFHDAYKSNTATKTGSINDDDLLSIKKSSRGFGGSSSGLTKQQQGLFGEFDSIKKDKQPPLEKHSVVYEKGDDMNVTPVPVPVNKDAALERIDEDLKAAEIEPINDVDGRYYAYGGTQKIGKLGAGAKAEQRHMIDHAITTEKMYADEAKFDDYDDEGKEEGAAAGVEDTAPGYDEFLEALDKYEKLERGEAHMERKSAKGALSRLKENVGRRTRQRISQRINEDVADSHYQDKKSMKALTTLQDAASTARVNKERHRGKMSDVVEELDVFGKANKKVKQEVAVAQMEDIAKSRATRGAFKKLKKRAPGKKIEASESGGAVGSPFADLEDEMFRAADKTPEKKEEAKEEKKSKSAKKHARRRQSSKTPIADRAANWIKNKNYGAMIDYLIKNKVQGYTNEEVAKKKLTNPRGKGAIKQDFQKYLSTTTEFNTDRVETRSMAAARSLGDEFKSVS